MNTHSFCPQRHSYISSDIHSLKYTQSLDNLKTWKSLSVNYFNNLLCSRFCNILDWVIQPEDFAFWTLAAKLRDRIQFSTNEVLPYHYQTGQELSMKGNSHRVLHTAQYNSADINQAPKYTHNFFPERQFGLNPRPNLVFCRKREEEMKPGDKRSQKDSLSDLTEYQ